VRDEGKNDEAYPDTVDELFRALPEFHAWYAERWASQPLDDPYWWRNAWTVLGIAGLSTFFIRKLRDATDESVVARCLVWIEDRARDPDTEDLIEVGFLENLGDVDEIIGTTLAADEYQQQFLELRESGRPLLGHRSRELLEKNEAGWRRVGDAIAAKKAEDPTYKTASEVMLERLSNLARESKTRDQA
jgi:hypothetical protein